MIKPEIYRAHIEKNIFKSEHNEKQMKDLIVELGRIDKRITLNTSLLELIEIFNIDENKKIDFEKRIKIAPSPIIAIEHILKEIHEEMNEQSCFLGNQLIESGKNVCVNEVGYIFFDQVLIFGEHKHIPRERDINLNFLDVEHELKNLAKGAFYAHFRNFLRNELKKYKQEKNIESIGDNIESMPDYQFKSISQKIAWILELGIVENCLALVTNSDGTYNYSRAANLISTFTDIKSVTIRKSIEAIYKPHKDNKKNHPLNSEENQLFIEIMKVKFKLDKTKEA